MTEPLVDRDGPEHEQPIIRDKRRIDPQTGAVRAPAGETPPAPAPAGPGAAVTGADETLRAQLDERTADLQRLKAEYDNYRRRVERDRQAVAETALANVLANLLPVLDDIDRARQHGELEGGFRSVGESIEAIVGKLGLDRFGEKGEPFDPTVHEALMHGYSRDVDEPVCVDVLQPGYRLGSRVLRPARVVVHEPDETIEPAAD